ncbi:MAG: hypothetical protein ABSB76_38065 [Streptosporangiaceae bacterium]|jgi:hypothetical protein
MPTTATEPESAVTAQAPLIDTPKHPLHTLTTYELRDYCRQLENAIAFSGQQAPVPAVRDDLQATLDAVTAEQESRERLTRA